MDWKPIEDADNDAKSHRVLGYGHKVYPADPTRRDNDYFIARYEGGHWVTDDVDVDTREVELVAFVALTPPNPPQA